MGRLERIWQVLRCTAVIIVIVIVIYALPPSLRRPRIVVLVLVVLIACLLISFVLFDVVLSLDAPALAWWSTEWLTGCLVWWSMACCMSI